MDKIASFNIDHTKLIEGVYVSRIDVFKDSVITTYDIRIKRPNKGDYLSEIQAHTIEHMGATFFRNDEMYKCKTVYFGPMGCNTGFYLLLNSDESAKEVFPAVKRMFEFILSYTGNVPGQSERECGNYKNLSLDEAKKVAKEYLDKTAGFTDNNFNYS